jgi:hypothetical protein
MSETADAAKVTFTRSAMSAAETQALFHLGYARLSSFLEVEQALDDRLHEMTLLAAQFKIRHRLYNRHSPSPARQENRAMRFGDVPDNFAGIDLDIAERDHVF